MPRFTLTQLLMTVWLVAILLSFLEAEGCGRKFTKVSDLEFSPDGRRLAVVRNNARDANAPLKAYLADVSRTIGLLDVATGAVDRVIETEKRPGDQGPAVGLYRRLQKSVAFASGGQRLLVQEFGKAAIKIYDIDSGLWQRPPEGTVPGRRLNFAATPDGTRAAISTANFLVSWDLESGKAVSNEVPATFSFAGAPLIAVSADGELAALAEHSAIDLRKTGDGSLVKSVSGLTNDDVICTTAISPDGRHIAVGAETWLRLYDLETLRPRTLLAGRGIPRVAFSPDNKTLAAADEDRVLLIDVASGREAGELPSRGGITSLAYSPQGDLLAAGDTTGSVTLWDLNACKRVWTVNAPGPWGVSWVWPGVVLTLWGLICYKIWKRRSGIEQATARGMESRKGGATAKEADLPSALSCFPPFVFS